MDRRHFIAAASYAIGGTMVLPMLGRAAEFMGTNKDPVAETSSGKVRGVNNKGVYTFKGIPYGASTAGANRFMPPRKPQPWAGVRDCLAWGPSCPQGLGPGGAPVMAAPADSTAGNEFGLVFNGGDTDTPYSEDCLVVNVFTRGLRDGKKRPVMVWIHGGGFSIGLGAGARTDGTNLARNHDVVSVSLNHRLGVLGYCHLGDLDHDFAASGNVGQLDLVAALEWVRDNIEAFGGDPNNVMVHGESGGGAKIHILMAMPAAKGLFHRAVCQSGVVRNFGAGWGIPGQPDRTRATELALELLKDAGLEPNQIGDLQQMPIERLYAASKGPGPGRNYTPVVGTADFPEIPNVAIAKGYAPIPYIVGCSMHEGTLTLGAISKTATEEDLQKRVSASAGAHAAEMIAGYRKNHPDYSPGDLLVRIMSDGTRFASIKAAEAHIQGGGAPTYMYLFDWESPRLPILKATHASDCSFYFGNTEALGMSKGIPEAQRLSVKMSTAWTTFARKGDPSTPAMPWSAYTKEQRATMVFTANPKIENDPMGGDRLIWEKLTNA